VQGHLLPDHVHMCLEIPPKYAVASVVGFLKGKSAMAIARERGRTGGRCEISSRMSVRGPTGTQSIKSINCSRGKDPRPPTGRQ
jgi:REP element-mobilizing transposase RayT